ncbi:hypothetical protein [Dyadobacter sp.]|uniref:hypothetical protein n=1 Tax=Dyadobacter sp. TaxID=1914288 RepID=UPI003F71C9F7
MNLKRTLPLILLSLFILKIESCTAQTEPAQPIPEGFKSCCGIEPVTFKSRKTSIYVPNVFTPNGDGINDTFAPFVNSEVLTLINFTILTPGKDTVLYHTTKFDISQMREYAWNGKNWNNGSVYSGPFVYGMEVMDQERKLSIVEGRACAIPCKKEMVVFKTKEGCFYAAQATNEGTVDGRKPNLEQDCF